VTHPDGETQQREQSRQGCREQDAPPGRRKVCPTIKELVGTMPEELRAADHVKEARKRVKAKRAQGAGEEGLGAPTQESIDCGNDDAAPEKQCKPVSLPVHSHNRYANNASHNQQGIRSTGHRHNKRKHLLSPVKESAMLSLCDVNCRIASERCQSQRRQTLRRMRLAETLCSTPSP